MYSKSYFHLIFCPSRLSVNKIFCIIHLKNNFGFLSKFIYYKNIQLLWEIAISRFELTDMKSAGMCVNKYPARIHNAYAQIEVFFK